MTSESAWYSNRVQAEVRLVQWGRTGVPVLVFPTAGGDEHEIDRNGILGALAPMIEPGRISVFSVDSVAGRSWLRGDDPRHSMWLQNRFHEMIYREVVPAIRAESEQVEVITAGASIGAFNAVATLCRYPDAFRAAIAMSGTYDLTHWLHGQWSDDFYYASPLHFLPNLHDEPLLERLRERFVVLATGRGRWEDEGETWKIAHVLGRQGIPNRVDLWSEQHDHDWPTWREMLPLYLDDLV